MSGCFVPRRVINNNPAWAGGISVSLGKPGNQIFGGPIGGFMTAETPVHVMVGEFPAGDQRPVPPNTMPPAPVAPAPEPVVPSSAPSPAAPSRALTPAALSLAVPPPAPSSTVPALGSPAPGPASLPFDVEFGRCEENSNSWSGQDV